MIQHIMGIILALTKNRNEFEWDQSNFEDAK